MMHNPSDGLVSQRAFAYSCVAVLMRPQRVHTVINMKSLQLLKPYHFIKLSKYLVRICCNIISCIAHMTCVETYTHFIAQLNPVKNLTNFFEPASHFAAFACHCLQKHRCSLLRSKYPVKQLRNLFNSFLNTLPNVTARMKVVVISRHTFHPYHVVAHCHESKLADALFGRARIKCVRCVCNQLAELLCPKHFAQSCRIFRHYVLSLAPSRVSCKKGKCVCADR